MTRPDKHAARFGDRYRPPIDYRRLAKAVRESLPIIRSITAAVRRVGEGLRNRSLTVVPSQSQPGRLALVPREHWTFAPYAANRAAPTVAELEAAIRGISHASLGTHSGGDVVDIDTGSPSDDPLAGPEWATRYSRSSGPLTWTAATVTATSLREMSFGFRTPDDRPLLDRIDDTLLTYDSQHATGEQPWPYGSSF